MKTLLYLCIISVFLSQDINQSLDRFSEIEVQLHAHTTVHFADEHRIEIDGPKKELDDIKFEVYKNTLVVESKRRNRIFSFRFGDSDRIRIKIYTKELTHVDIGGGGLLRLPDFDQKDLDINASGSTDIKLSGKISHLTIDKSGSGDIKLDHFKSEKFIFEKSGSGDLEVDGTAQDVRIDKSGSGDISWYGIDANEIVISSHGSGGFSFKGKANLLDVDMSGSGDLDGFRFEVNQLRAELHGSCDMKITVNEELDARVSGSADLVYAGRPEVIRKDENGSGDIKRR